MKRASNKRISPSTWDMQQVNMNGAACVRKFYELCHYLARSAVIIKLQISICYMASVNSAKVK
jgi:hypothetical protein